MKTKKPTPKPLGNVKTAGGAVIIPATKKPKLTPMHLKKPRVP